MLGYVRKTLKRWPLLRQVVLSTREELAYRRSAPSDGPLGFRFGGNAAMEGGGYEEDEVRVIRRLLGGCQAFVDVGANVGIFSCLSRAAGVRTIAVEPHPANVRRLLRNLSANGWTDVEVFPVAVGSSPGVATIHGTGTAASLLAGWAGDQGAYSLEIPVSTLDIVIGARLAGLRVVVKADVEGFEAAMLQGASALLAQEPAPTWLLEIVLTQHVADGLNPRFTEVFERFWAHGYQASTLDRRPISQADVARWVAARGTDVASCSYLFWKGRGPLAAVG